MPRRLATIRSLTSLALASLALGAGCGGPTAPPPEAGAGVDTEGPRDRPATFEFGGVVRHVDPDEGTAAYGGWDTDSATRRRPLRNEREANREGFTCK